VPRALTHSAAIQGPASQWTTSQVIPFSSLITGFISFSSLKELETKVNVIRTQKKNQKKSKLKL
jgi:hypothetical protein